MADERQPLRDAELMDNGNLIGHVFTEIAGQQVPVIEVRHGVEVPDDLAEKFAELESQD